MKAQVFLFLQVLIALAMMFSTFCRLTKTDGDTHREIRWAFVFEATAAGLVAAAPFLPLLVPEANWAPYTTPTGLWLVLLLAVYVVQLVTARYWREGCPEAFQCTHTPPSRNVLPALGAAGVALVVGLLVAGPQLVVAKAAVDAPAGQDPWRPVEGDSVYLPQGGEMRCTNPAGCFAFTTEGLQGLLRQAGGTCGRIPSQPGLKQPNT